MIKCKNGHTYDEKKYSHCPKCDDNYGSETIALKSNKRFLKSNTDFQSSTSESFYTKNNSDWNDSPDFSSVGYLDQYVEEDDKTIGVYQKAKGFNPVVGWLVCIEGASKGKDYIIRAERNFIGNNQSNDICITGDNTISAKKHAIISYNYKETTFRIMPGDGHGIIYLNNNEVFEAEKLKRGDIIQIGQTSLIFIPLCGEDFNW